MTEWESIVWGLGIAGAILGIILTGRKLLHARDAKIEARTKLNERLAAYWEKTDALNVAVTKLTDAQSNIVTLINKYENNKAAASSVEAAKTVLLHLVARAAVQCSACEDSSRDALIAALRVFEAEVVDLISEK